MTIKEIRERIVEKAPYAMEYVADPYKAKEMCEKVVKWISWLLEYVPGPEDEDQRQQDIGWYNDYK